MNIGQALKKVRKDTIYTQVEWASKVGITQTYMSQIENGLKIPSLEVIAAYEEISKKPLAIILWYGIEESAVPKSKRKIYQELKPLVDNLIAQIFQ